MSDREVDDAVLRLRAELADRLASETANRRRIRELQRELDRLGVAREAAIIDKILGLA